MNIRLSFLVRGRIFAQLTRIRQDPPEQFVHNLCGYGMKGRSSGPKHCHVTDTLVAVSLAPVFSISYNNLAA